MVLMAGSFCLQTHIMTTMTSNTQCFPPVPAAMFAVASPILGISMRMKPAKAGAGVIPPPPPGAFPPSPPSSPWVMVMGTDQLSSTAAAVQAIASHSLLLYPAERACV